MASRVRRLELPGFSGSERSGGRATGVWKSAARIAEDAAGGRIAEDADGWAPLPHLLQNVQQISDFSFLHAKKDSIAFCAIESFAFVL